MQYGRFAKVYDALMAEVEYDAWAAYIASFLPGGALSIADCACGTGEITLRLCRMGHKVTGIDISEEMLRVASEKARARGLKIPFARQNIAELSLHRPVDAVVCACDGVNYLTSLHDARRFFEAAYAQLKENGLLLFDISSRYKLARVLGNNMLGYDDESLAYVWKNCYDEKNALIEMEMSFFTKNERGLYERFCETHVQRAHTAAELTRLLLGAGFSKVGVYEAFTQNAPRENAERLQFVAAKGA